MPVLNWIGKDKVVNHDQELPFRVLKPEKELSVGKNSNNLLIEGDNLEALKALMPFYFGKVKLIYIDPPYNTGTENWIYNDNVSSPQIKSWISKVVGPEGKDLCRHDKWLCMMYPRLKLLKDLLKDDGVIFASIGQEELANLRCLMDEIYHSENFVSVVTRVAKTASNKGRYFAPSVDYLLCYAKDINLLPEFSAEVDASLYKKIEISGPRKGEMFRDDIALYQSSLDTRPNQRYYIECPDGSLVIPPGKTFPTQNTDCAKAVPQDGDGVWRWSVDTYIKNKELIVYKNTKNSPMLDQNGNQAKWNIYTKSYLSDRRELGTKPRDFLDKFINRKSADFLKTIDINFDYAKPVDLIKYLIKISSTGDDDIILDSFAGSGTTGQAVLEANNEDGKSRRFILIELEREIAKKTTAKRLKTVIEGISDKNIKGLGGSFKYLDLNGELYNYSGFVNTDAKYEDMAAYIYFTETKNYLDLSVIKNPYIGSQGSTHYFLFFKNKGNNILDKATLKKTDDLKGLRVIYADKCLIDEEELAKLGVTFKQIPYELKKY